MIQGRLDLLSGDLLELEGWYFVDDYRVCVEFRVTWRHPHHGVSGIYRPGGCGFDASCEIRAGAPGVPR
jgi:hypothetical protein